MIIRGVALVAGLAVSLLAAPLAAEGQTRVYRVGFLAQGSPPTPGQPRFFRSALQELGYVEGQSLMLEFRYAEGRNERFPGLAADLVALKHRIKCHQLVNVDRLQPELLRRPLDGFLRNPPEVFLNRM